MVLVNSRGSTTLYRLSLSSLYSRAPLQKANTATLSFAPHLSTAFESSLLRFTLVGTARQQTTESTEQFDVARATVPRVGVATMSARQNGSNVSWHDPLTLSTNLSLRKHQRPSEKKIQFFAIAAGTLTEVVTFYAGLQR